MAETKHLAELYNQAEKLSLSVKGLLDEVAQRQKSPDDLMLLEQIDLSAKFISQRKSEMVSFSELELQTDISESTLKRLFKNPQKATLENVLTVARELGIKIWIEK